MRVLLILLLFTASSAVVGQTSRFHEGMAAAIDTGNYSFALEQLNRHIYDNPYDFHAYKLRGQGRKAIKANEGALTDYNIYLEHHPEDYEAHFNRALLRYQTGRYELATSDFLQLIKNDTPPSTTTVYFQQSSNSNTGTSIFTVQSGVRSIYYYYLGSSYYHQDKPSDAIAYLDSALLSAPNNVDYLIARALAREKIKQFDEAIADYEAALSKVSDHGLAKYNLGNLLNRLGKTEEGAAYLEESIEEQPELAYPYAEKAFRYMENGVYDIALQEYNKAIAINGENTDYLLNRGKVKLKLSDLNGAAKDFQQVMQLMPENEQVYLNMALVEYKKGRYHEAIELLDIAIFYYPEYSLAYYNRAIAYHALGDKEKACSDIHLASKLDFEIPKDINAFCQN
jgi:tetratricopeptide (TPR) repeat protein